MKQHSQVQSPVGGGEEHEACREPHPTARSHATNQQAVEELLRLGQEEGDVVGQGEHARGGIVAAQTAHVRASVQSTRRTEEGKGENAWCAARRRWASTGVIMLSRPCAARPFAFVNARLLPCPWRLR